MVDAGPDMAIDLPNSASLDGTVNDDDLPSPPQLTTTWSKVSGPGTVSFADPNVVDTTASFENAGTYVLQLTADDGELSDFDELTVTVNSSGASTQDLDLVWAKRAGSLLFESGRGLAVDDSGNTYVTGSYGGGFGDPAIFGPGEAGETVLAASGESRSMFVAKYAANGNLIWAKRTGGNAFVESLDLAIDSSGNTYVTGQFLQFFGSTTTFGPGETNETTFSNDIGIPISNEFDNSFRDMFVAKYTADGNLVVTVQTLTAKT